MMQINLIKNAGKFAFDQLNKAGTWIVLSFKTILLISLIVILWTLGTIATIALVALIIKPITQQDGILQQIAATGIILLFLITSYVVIKYLIKISNTWALNALDAAYPRPWHKLEVSSVSGKIPWLLLIQMVLIVLGLLCLVIPGIIFTIRFSLARYAMLDYQCGIIQALHRSWKMTKGQEWSLLSVSLIFFLCRLFPPFWLFELILPISNLIYASIYLQLKNYHQGQTLTGETV